MQSFFSLLSYLLVRLLVLLIRGYQLFISPFTPAACRFTPTCSEYALTALQRHGIFRGSFLALRRLFRCHPWGGSGYDPVPERREKGESKEG